MPQLVENFSSYFFKKQRDLYFIWNWDVGAEFRISIKKPELQGLRP